MPRITGTRTLNRRRRGSWSYPSNRVCVSRAVETDHMHMDPLLTPLVDLAFAVLILGQILKKLRQPYVLGCLLAAILLGPKD